MESCLKQEKASFTSPSIRNLFIVHESDSWSQDLNIDFTLKGCLYGGVELLAKTLIQIHLYILVLVLDLIRV